LGLAAYDELSAEAKKVLEATMNATERSALLVKELATLVKGMPLESSFEQFAKVRRISGI
jgi:hypothetical protein